MLDELLRQISLHDAEENWPNFKRVPWAYPGGGVSPQNMGGPWPLWPRPTTSLVLTVILRLFKSYSLSSNAKEKIVDYVTYLQLCTNTLDLVILEL